MKGRGAAVYAATLFVLMIGGMIAVVVFAFGNTDSLIEAACGLLASCVLTPTVHEMGHYSFAVAGKMKVRYCKCFCFRLLRKDGKTKFSFCNPFAPDETQAIPTSPQKMKQRALRYCAGGLFFGGGYFFVVTLAAALTSALGTANFAVWGLVPYAAYLFFLNVAPLEYPSGKTDSLIVRGIRKGEPAETVMLRVMEIHGELYEGKSFGEIDKERYFDLPQLAEDEPLFAAVLDLRYRYALEKEDYALAHDQLRRLTDAEEYLTDEAYFSLRTELVYFSLLHGDDKPLKTLYEADEAFLRSDDYKAKRILALYSSLTGKTEEAETLIQQAKELLKREEIVGEKKFEEALLARIKTKKTVND